MHPTTAASATTVREPLPENAYVAGFVLDTRGRVLLIRKQRPAWQAGRLNAIGGKIEAGETPLQAMRRECREEADLAIDDWDHLATLDFPQGGVWFFRARVPDTLMDAARALTDEPLEAHDTRDVAHRRDVIPNLAWLLPLAVYAHDRYQPVHVVELS